MFGNEPDLQLVTANHVADDKLVVASSPASAARRAIARASFSTIFVRMQQSRDPDGDFFNIVAKDDSAPATSDPSDERIGDTFVSGRMERQRRKVDTLVS